MAEGEMRHGDVPQTMVGLAGRGTDSQTGIVLPGDILSFVKVRQPGVILDPNLTFRKQIFKKWLKS